MSEQAFANLMPFLKASADPLRLSLLRVLGAGSFGVQELADIFQMAQPGMSHHLKLLAQADLVETRREGNYVFYRRTLPAGDQGKEALKRTLFLEIDKQPLGEDLHQRLDQVLLEREERSKDFFLRYSAEFSQRKKLIAEFDQYGRALIELMGHLKGDVKKVLEVGPGQGELLPLLAQRYEEVYAVDRSDSMLAMAQQAAGSYVNVRFLVGDFRTVLPEDFRVDLIVLNMVMHHQASPEDVFMQAVRLLNRDGGLLVADLCSHHQNWVRESCGDQWLGFDPKDLSQWAQRAGLCPGPQLFQCLKNGFQIQMRLFFRE